MLSTGRVSIVGFCVANLSKAVPIAVRYSAVRKQFGTPDKELPVLEYQLQVCYRKYALGNKYTIRSYKKDNYYYYYHIPLIFACYYTCLRNSFSSFLLKMWFLFCWHIFISNTKDFNDSSNPVSKTVHTWVLPPIKTITIWCSKINLNLSCLLGLSCLIHFFAISLFANSIFCPLIDAIKPHLVCQPTS